MQFHLRIRVEIYLLLQRIRWHRLVLGYRFRHWIFQWKQDDEGDLAFVLFNRLVFLKYKEHTLIRLNGHQLQEAGKWQGSRHQWS